MRLRHLTINHHLRQRRLPCHAIAGAPHLTAVLLIIILISHLLCLIIAYAATAPPSKANAALIGMRTAPAAARPRVHFTIRVRTCQAGDPRVAGGPRVSCRAGS